MMAGWDQVQVRSRQVQFFFGERPRKEKRGDPSGGGCCIFRNHVDQPLGLDGLDSPGLAVVQAPPKAKLCRLHTMCGCIDVEVVRLFVAFCLLPPLYPLLPGAFLFQHLCNVLYSM